MARWCLEIARVFYLYLFHCPYRFVLQPKCLPPKTLCITRPSLCRPLAPVRTHTSPRCTIT